MESQENRRVKNAQETLYDGILFKSKLEVTCYKMLKDAGLPVQYEPQKIIIWTGFKPTVPFYDKDSATRTLKPKMDKIRDSYYTPDFMFQYADRNIIIEAKGFEGEVFAFKKKLFRKWLESNLPDSIYFEVYNKKQILQTIEIIKLLKKENNE